MTEINKSQEDIAGKSPHSQIGFLGYVWRLARVAIATFFLIFCVFLGGFFSFAIKVSWSEPPKNLQGDGMVVLTGGAKRIETALTLMTEGAATKLLISGVAAETSSGDLAQRYNDYAGLFECCIDLDKGAENTVGNGTQTGHWIRDNQFKTVLLVTSAYHLPRAMVELSHSSSQTHFIAVPVIHGGLDLKAWYQDIEIMELMVREYAKYLAALTRIAFKRGYKTLSDKIGVD